MRGQGRSVRGLMMMLAAMLGATAASASEQASDPEAPPPRTMRLDYFHTGNVDLEVFAVDELVLEPLPWPGHPQRAFDTTGRGDYFFELVDEGSGETLYSRGFSSIYAEWEADVGDWQTWEDWLRPSPSRAEQ